jgi:predicted ATP-dependent endonuclease of OLD family
MAVLGKHSPDQPLTPEIRRQIDERIIRSSSASNAMSRKFENWWEQRKVKFHYTFDGRYFRILVSDDLDESQIELDQRSAGLQYFFSFYLVFQVEAEGAHANSILLLDDPGKDLHGRAQAKIVELLERLAEDNQVLYTTHSPFMVDARRLERVRPVWEAEDGTTKVSDDVWPRDRDALYPLQAALGYSIAQALFISKRQTVVEGLGDKWILEAMDEAMLVKEKTRLRPEIMLVPAGGVSHLLPLASMLVGHDVEIAALLDGDEPGRKEGTKLAQKLLGGDDRKCVFIGDFANKHDAELEDLFPEKEYLSAVAEAYSDVPLDFTDDEKTIESIVDRVTALFARKSVKFEKWRPAAVLRDRILAAPENVDETTCRVVSAIFARLNELFTTEESTMRPTVPSGDGKRPARLARKTIATNGKRRSS